MEKLKDSMDPKKQAKIKIDKIKQRKIILSSKQMIQPKS